MNPLHTRLILVISSIVAGLTLFIFIFFYLHHDTIPKDTIVAGWSVGGLNIDTALEELDERIQHLEKLPLHITVNNPSNSVVHSQWTFAEAGVQYEAELFRLAIIQLQQGNWFQRISYRWNFERSYTITSRWDPTYMKSVYDTAWEQEKFGQLLNASRRINSSDQVVYTPGISANRLDWNTLETSMLELIPRDFEVLEPSNEDPLVLELPFRLERPEIDIEDLKKEGIQRKIMEFSTYLRSSGEGRVFNVNSAAQATNGMILKPGDVFDYGQVIATAEKQFGFREAPVILNGKFVPGVGGGICQVSSTIYSAAIRLGLDIVERRNHSMPVSYLPKGQDATFATGSINFRFKNNTGKHLLIQANVHGRTLTVKFFGTFPANVHYDIESVVVETLTPSNKYVRNDTLPLETQEILQQGTIGYVVDTYQIKKVDGIVKDKKRISRDTYLAQKRLISVHPNNDMNIATPVTPAKKPIIEDGVSGPNF